MHPVPVHAEGAEEHAAVVAAQVVVEEIETLGLQFEEHGVDELHDVIALQSWQQAPESPHEQHAAEFARMSRHIDIARIILPEVAVGDDTDLVAQCAQRLCEGGMHVAVFAYEQDFHCLWNEEVNLTTRMRTEMPGEVLERRRNQLYFVV